MVNWQFLQYIGGKFFLSFPCFNILPIKIYSFNNAILYIQPHIKDYETTDPIIFAIKITQQDNPSDIDGSISLNLIVKKVDFHNIKANFLDLDICKTLITGIKIYSCKTAILHHIKAISFKLAATIETTDLKMYGSLRDLPLEYVLKVPIKKHSLNVKYIPQQILGKLLYTLAQNSKVDHKDILVLAVYPKIDKDRYANIKHLEMSNTLECFNNLQGQEYIHNIFCYLIVGKIINTGQIVKALIPENTIQ